MKRIFCIALLLACALSARLQAAPSSVRAVKTLAIERLAGDRTFGPRVVRELRALGFVFVRDKRRADALVDARGDWQRGGFRGTLVLRAQNGAVLWRETAYRPPNSRVMASTRLTSKLRRAVGK